MNKKAFTLIEVLATIVIIALVALITIPIVGNIIQASEIKTAEISANNFIREATNQYGVQNDIDSLGLEYIGELIDIDSVNVKNKPEEAFLKVNPNGTINGTIRYGDHILSYFNSILGQPYWEFQIEIEEGDLDFTFALEDADLNIEWGDGTNSNESFTGSRYISHSYSKAGIYDVKISGTVDRVSFATTASYLYDCDSLTATPEKLRDINAYIPSELGINNVDAMLACTTVEEFSDENFLADVLPEVTSLNFLFRNASNFNQDISHWDISNITSIRQMFGRCENFNKPLNNWDTSSLENIDELFTGAEKFNHPLNNWDISNVTSLYSVFQNARLFNENISNWDTSSVTTMFQTFIGATSFNQDISNWDVSNVTSMANTFVDAESFNQPIGTWNVSSVERMDSIFRGAKSFNQNINSWNTVSLTSLSNAFNAADSFNQPLNNWNISNVTQLAGVFTEAINFNQNINSWDTSNVTSMGHLFYGATSFDQPLNSWNTNKVTSMSMMFTYATSFNQDLYWCNPLIPSEPLNFDLGAYAWTRHKPFWGGCP